MYVVTSIIHDITYLSYMDYFKEQIMFSSEAFKIHTIVVDIEKFDERISY